MAGAAMKAALGLGSNLGDRAAHIAEACRHLAQNPKVRLLSVSALYETAPWGMTEQGPFLNACAAMETTLEPKPLLEFCLATERLMGRVREERWGPRIIDLDILIYGAAVVKEQHLTIPHPHMAERGFVIVPLAEIWPEALIGGRSAKALAADFKGDPSIRCFAPGPELTARTGQVMDAAKPTT